MRLKLMIDGMSCEHCVKHVKEALTEIKGVSDICVNIEKTTIEVDESVKFETIKSAIEEAGYELIGVTEN